MDITEEVDVMLREKEQQYQQEVDRLTAEANKVRYIMLQFIYQSKALSMSVHKAV